MSSMEFDKVVTAWTDYIGLMDDWQVLVKGVAPKRTGCGLIYELDNPISRPDRPGESFAIADMRGLAVAEPHYHRGGETEIYVVITGTGWVLVGETKEQLTPGSVVVTPSGTGHATFPEENLVLAVINTPPFKADNYVALTGPLAGVVFDYDKFLELSQLVFNT
jgi:mannose-6-phosphate isomerase-like protein (cupin superfamily)